MCPSNADPAPSFRRAVPEDLSAIFEIRYAVTENMLSDRSKVTPQMCLDYMDRLGRGWVCERGGQIVGFSYAAKADGSIWALFVRPGHEGHGVGQELLRLAVDWLFGIGKTELRLSTTVQTRAERFYLAQGWERREKNGESEVWFRLRSPSAD